MMKRYYQMSREELEDCLKELFDTKQLDPDVGTILFIDEDGAVILDRFEEPKHSVIQIKHKGIEEIIETAKEFDPFVEIVYRPWLMYEVKSALNNYLRKQPANNEDDFVTYLVGNA